MTDRRERELERRCLSGDIEAYEALFLLVQRRTQPIKSTPITIKEFKESELDWDDTTWIVVTYKGFTRSWRRCDTGPSGTIKTYTVDKWWDPVLEPRRIAHTVQCCIDKLRRIIRDRENYRSSCPL